LNFFDKNAAYDLARFIARPRRRQEVKSNNVLKLERARAAREFRAKIISVTVVFGCCVFAFVAVFWFLIGQARLTEVSARISVRHAHFRTVEAENIEKKIKSLPLSDSSIEQSKTCIPVNDKAEVLN
jgi:hypothetical protein